MVPEELAHQLGVTAKELRSWLRSSFPRTSADKGARWELGAIEIDRAREHFAARTPPVSAELPSSAASSTVNADVVEAFVDASHFTRAEVLAAPCPVPTSPGVYGWWFERPPVAMDVADCLVRQGRTLLYTGISPKRPPMNGRAASRQTLRERIRYHYSGNAEGSTLRKTLGILLANELGIELRRVGSGKRMTFVDGEQKLSAWMAENAFVSWIIDPEPWLVEHHLIRSLDVPLNLDGNAHNRFHRDLTDRRAHAVARAREKAAIPNPGVGGR